MINMSDRTLTAEAAIARLGISRQTLYAYVSRGLVRALPAPDDPRRSRYDARDIEALIERRRRGRARKAVAASTIDWGEPLLASRITRIADGKFFYRGQDAVALAETATLEETARVLWQADRVPALPASRFTPVHARLPLQRCLRAAASLAGPGIWARPLDPDRADHGQPDLGLAVSGLPIHALADSSSGDRRLGALHREAFALLRLLAEAAGGARATAPIHLALATAWGAPRGAELLRRALVLVADHELNASAFAVRVVASTGASLPACTLAGLAALSGPRHGGMTEQAAAMFADNAIQADPEAGLAARLARGERLPGFGHRLYPEGDPRARALLEAIGPNRIWSRLIAAGTALTGAPPNLDLALAALEQQLHLPAGAGLALFAIGRSAGWIAHALEQHQDGRLIRPRAAYVGP